MQDTTFRLHQADLQFILSHSQWNVGHCWYLWKCPLVACLIVSWSLDPWPPLIVISLILT